MPASAYAKVLVALNGGGNQTGGITATPGDVVHLSGENSAYWDHALWEIYSYPAGWALPAGWTAQGGSYVSSAITPPTFTLPALPAFGKWLLRLTVDDGMTNGKADLTKVDKSTAVQTLSANGLYGISAKEEGQFSATKAWAGGLEQDIITLDGRLTTLGSGLSISGQTAGDILYFNGTAWVPIHGGADGKTLTATGATTAPIWNYWNDLSFDWGQWGNCVHVMDPANALLSGSNVTNFVDSGPLHLAGVTNNFAKDADGTNSSPGSAQYVASDPNFNGLPSLDFYGHNARYGTGAQSGLLIGDSHNFAIPGYAGPSSALKDFTFFFAVHLSAVASSISGVISTNPALWSGQNGSLTQPGISANFQSGNLLAVAGYTPSGGGGATARTASIPFAIGQTKVVTQRYRESDTTLSIRDGLGAWSTTATPPVGATNVQLLGQPHIGASDGGASSTANTRWFDGQLGYFVGYRAALTDAQCICNIKQLLGRFRL